MYANTSGGEGNISSAEWGTVGGGFSNLDSAANSVIGGGSQNIIYAGANTEGSVIAGGDRNWIYHNNSFIGGGFLNRILGAATVIGGGNNNHTSAYGSAVIGGGDNNYAWGYQSFIGGGYSNTVGHQSFVGGGGNNTINGDFGVIGGGDNNSIPNNLATRATIGGGHMNTAGNNYSTISGGSTNSASADFTTVGGGNNNSASGTNASILGGESNIASATHATVGGGANNTASGVYSNVVGGSGNTADGDHAFIGGGSGNSVAHEGLFGAIGGGSNNRVYGYSFIGSGENNFTSSYDFIGAGSNNSVGSFYSSILGGLNNNIPEHGDYSTIAGGNNLRLWGVHNFGFNGDASSNLTDIFVPNIAYFGNVDLWLGNVDGTAREMRFYSPNTSYTYGGSKYSSFKAQSQDANITYTFPASAPSVNQSLTASAVSGSNVTLAWSSTPKYSTGSVASADGGTTIPNDIAIIRLTSGATAAFSYTLPSGAEGQLLYIYNNSGYQANNAAANIPDGSTYTFVYINSGWRRAQ